MASEIFYYILVFFAGASVGSFSITAANRIASNKDFIRAPSACDNCGELLKFYELIPVISWFWQKNRCNYCGSKIGYEIVISEIACAFLFVGIVYIFGANLQGIYFLVFFGLLFAMSLSDLKSKAIYDSWLLILVTVSLIPVGADFAEKLKNFLIFCGGFFLLDFLVTFYIQNIKAKFTNNESLKTQKALGDADMIIAGAIGANLGLVFGLGSIFLASCLAIIPSILNTIYKKDSELPFVPFLACGFLIAICAKEVM